MDRRHQDIRPDTLIVAGILFAMGWYASPWQPMDTLFTQTLARLNLEDPWAFLFMVAGILKAASAVMRNACPMWLSFSANWLSALICIWTGIIFAKYGPLTPTIAACWVIGVGSLASLYRNARQKQRIRMLNNGARAEGGS